MLSLGIGHVQIEVMNWRRHLIERQGQTLVVSLWHSFGRCVCYPLLVPECQLGSEDGNMPHHTTQIQRRGSKSKGHPKCKATGLKRLKGSYLKDPGEQGSKNVTTLDQRHFNHLPKRQGETWRNKSSSKAKATRRVYAACALACGITCALSVKHSRTWPRNIPFLVGRSFSSKNPPRTGRARKIWPTRLITANE